MIHYNEEFKTFSMHTKNTTYQFKIEEYGVLLHLYYGSRVQSEDLSYLVVRGDRGFSGNPYEAKADRTFSLDTLPQEYPSFSVGDYRVGTIHATDSRGYKGADFRYDSHRILSGKYGLEGLPAIYEDKEEEAITLEVKLCDKISGLEVKLLYGVFYEQDIITRTVKICNSGINTVTLNRALSMNLDLMFGDWELLHFYGRHSMEREAERAPIIQGITTLSSNRGTSSHHQNPSFILCSPNCSEEFGECYGISLVYSGSFTTEIEKDQMGQVRVVTGQGDNNFSWELKPEDEFTAPEVVLSYSNLGFSKLSHSFHTIFQNNLCRGKYKLKERPILINNWEATYFNFDETKLIDIAEQASELGVEMLVMDDGWFGKRNSDETSLGDWYVNKEKLPNGLSYLVNRVNQLGLKFGIWFEPEMISKESDLYEKHPDWVLKVPGREPNYSRNQLVLDMSREDVRDYLFDRISAVLNEANIEYVKWDMNRSICNWYSNGLPAHRQGELSHRYMLGVYDLLERLFVSYPNVLFEGCSGGGGRFDPGMLYYHPQIWCSDNTDAVDRLRIQYGTSFFYPLSTVGSHVSAVPNHQTGRSTSMEMRGLTAMAGTFGYELDITKLTEDEKECVKEQIKYYKEKRDLIMSGTYYRILSPYDKDGCSAWLIVSPNQDSFLLSMAGERVHGNPRPMHIQLKGLNPEYSYQIDRQTYHGDTLMKGGIAFKGFSGDHPIIKLYGEYVNEAMEGGK